MFNDIHSAEKEWKTHAALDRPGLPLSSLFFIMERQDVSFGEAKSILKERMCDLELEFLELCNRTVENAKPEIVRIVLGYQYIVSGAMVWHLSNDRYRTDPSASFYPRPEHKADHLPRKIGSVHGRKKRDATDGKGERKRRFTPEGDQLVDGSNCSKRQKKASECHLERAPWLSKYPKLTEEVISCSPPCQ
ncbi:hypothetical protein ABW20_dc0109702 [Dactylellina cionopaga]|nr:hypothetical protein ABW20_dc0109702 [Dactylellina cionopaga]